MIKGLVEPERGNQSFIYKLLPATANPKKPHFQFILSGRIINQMKFVRLA